MMLVLLICLSLVFSYKGFFDGFIRSNYHRPLFISIWPVFWSKGSKLCINIILAMVPAGCEVLTITFSTRKAILKIIAAKRELHNDQLADKIWVIIPLSLISMDGKRRKIADQQYTFHERKIHSFTCGNFFNSLRVNGGHRFWVNLDVINQSTYLMKESIHIDMWTLKTCFVWQAQNISCFQKLKLLLLLHF